VIGHGRHVVRVLAPGPATDDDPGLVRQYQYPAIDEKVPDMNRLPETVDRPIPPWTRPVARPITQAGSE
jgi:hypothetical protein